uniref:Uncharacterized protein n=1 Tax=Arundo donax TaxID=35708 RepID=A0A0A9BKB5_ARUDO
MCEFIFKQIVPK